MDFESFKNSLPKISTKDIATNYNDGRIVDIKDLLTLALIYPKNTKNIIIMYSERKRKPSRLERIEQAIVQILERLEKIDKRIDHIEKRLDKHEKLFKVILDRLDKHDELFRAHGWIK